MLQSQTLEAPSSYRRLNHLAFCFYLKIPQPSLSLTLIGVWDEIRREVLRLPICLFLRSQFLPTHPYTSQRFSLNPTPHAH